MKLSQNENFKIFVQCPESIQTCSAVTSEALLYSFATYVYKVTYNM